MILFLLGIITGLLLAFLIFFCYLYFGFRGRNRIDEAIKVVEQVIRSRAKIFMPPTEEEEAQQEIIEKNKRAGRGTEAEELGI